MDKIFEKKAMMAFDHALKEIEPEMREAYYRHTSLNLDACSEAAYGYFHIVVPSMIENFKDEKLTIKELLRQLYTIRVTGEYSCYLNKITELGKKKRVFAGVQEIKGFENMQYAARLLWYYYQVFEKDAATKGSAAIVQNVYYRFEKMFEFVTDNDDKKSRKGERGLPDKETEPKDKADDHKNEADFMTKLKNHLDQYVVGQEKLKKKLCVLIYNWKYHGERSNLLMVGPSGSGKNYIMETIKSYKHLGMPMITCDCSQLTATGFCGDDVSGIFQKYKVEKNKNYPKAEYGIIYLDEVDKIINTHYDSHGDNVNANVQQQLLSALAGTEKFFDIDTSKILFILGGAFLRIEELDKYEKKQVGFLKDSSKQMTDFSTGLREKIIQIGGEQEFLGRIQQIEQMKPLSRSELKEVLLRPGLGELKKLQALYEKQGYILEVEEEVITAILDQTEHDPAGARSVKNILNQMIDSSYLYDLAILKKEGYNKLIIHKGVLSGEVPMIEKLHERKRGK